jgi:hypothetical protein
LNALLELIEAAVAEESLEQTALLLGQIESEVSGMAAVRRHGQSARAAEGVVIVLVGQVDAKSTETVDELVEAFGAGFDSPGETNARVRKEGEVGGCRAALGTRTAE